MGQLGKLQSGRLFGAGGMHGGHKGYDAHVVHSTYYMGGYLHVHIFMPGLHGGVILLPVHLVFMVCMPAWNVS